MTFSFTFSLVPLGGGHALIRQITLLITLSDLQSLLQVAGAAWLIVATADEHRRLDAA